MPASVRLWGGMFVRSNNQLSNANWWEAETSRRLEVSSIKRARKPKLRYDPTDNETSIAGTSNTKKHKRSSRPREEVDANDTVATIAPGPNAPEDATNTMATCDSTADPIIKPASLPLLVADVFDVTMAGDDIADPNHGTQSQSKQVIAPVADVLAGVLTDYTNNSVGHVEAVADTNATVTVANVAVAPVLPSYGVNSYHISTKAISAVATAVGFDAAAAEPTSCSAMTFAPSNMIDSNVVPTNAIAADTPAASDVVVTAQPTSFRRSS